MPPTPADPWAGKMLGKFAIERRLGQGGMGAVYRATDNLGRTVALKLLQTGFAADAEWVERFRREATKAAQLNSPHIVQVHEFGEAEGHHYLSMQFMPRGSLDGLLAERGPLAPAEAARIVRDAARGLARAHAAGMIHRDIKPANILLGEEGEVRLGDFGLVKSTRGGDEPLTQTGMVLGTPHYMAPEQCEGLPDVDGRVDLYALGLVLYQCLSNQLPVKGSTPLQIIRHRLQHDPPALQSVAPHVPASLAALVHELLVRDPARRLGSADELARRLDAFLQGGEARVSLASAPTMALSGSPAALAPGGVLPDIQVPPVVPTGRLVSVTPAATPVLPDLRAGPPPLPDLPRPAAPPPRSAWGVVLVVGCGLLLLLGLCVLFGLAAADDANDPYAGWQHR